MGVNKNVLIKVPNFYKNIYNEEYLHMYILVKNIIFVKLYDFN